MRRQPLTPGEKTRSPTAGSRYFEAEAAPGKKLSLGEMLLKNSRITLTAPDSATENSHDQTKKR
jgi:hypothetical protein